MSQGATEQARPDRGDLIPELQAIVDELDPIGWCSDNPSQECRRILTPPPYVRWFDGLDRLGLCWLWARLHVMARLSHGDLSKISETRNLRLAQIAYMHVTSWIAMECGHPVDLAYINHGELWFQIQQWEIEHAIPRNNEFLDACIRANEMVYGPHYRLGLAVGLVYHDSGVIPIGQHLSALRAAFRKHHMKKGLPPEDAEKAARGELGHDTLTAHAWIEALGDAANLGYFQDGRYLLASWDVERQLQKLFGARGKSVKRRGQPIADEADEKYEPAQPEAHGPLGRPDETFSLLHEVLRIIGLTDVDLDNPESITSLGSLIAEAAPRTSDPALTAAKICRLVPGSVRSKVARAFGVTESAVRRAEERL